MGVKLALAVGAVRALRHRAGGGAKIDRRRPARLRKARRRQIQRENPAFKQFTITRADVEEDKFTDKVGSQFVSTVYHGKAAIRPRARPQSVRFICLHAGFGKGAVFVYTLPR